MILPYVSFRTISVTISTLLNLFHRQGRLHSLDLLREESNRVVENRKRTNPRNTNLLVALRTGPVVLRHKVQEVTATTNHLTTAGKNHGVLDDVMVCVAKEDRGRVNLHPLSALHSMVFIQTRNTTTQYNSAPPTHLYSPLYALSLSPGSPSASLQCTDTWRTDDGRSSDPVLSLTPTIHSNAAASRQKRGLR